MLVYLMHVETLPFPLGTLINTSLEIWLEVSGLLVCFPEGYCFSTGVCVSPFLQGNLTSSNQPSLLTPERSLDLAPYLVQTQAPRVA